MTEDEFREIFQDAIKKGSKWQGIFKQKDSIASLKNKFSLTTPYSNLDLMLELYRREKYENYTIEDMLNNMGEIKKAAGHKKPTIHCFKKDIKKMLKKIKTLSNNE